MRHSWWILGLIVLAYVWHAVFELTEERLEEWFKKHPWGKQAVLATGAALLLAPAGYYASEFIAAIDVAPIT